MIRCTSVVAFGFGVMFCLTLPAAAFDLQGHRGARGLLPENTLKGFTAAIALGVSTLETDLALTKDGHLVLTHDPLLNPDIVRRADGEWIASRLAIRSMSLADVQLLDVGRLKPGTRYTAQWPQQVPQDGARMPTFAEFAALVKAAGRPIRINIETKLNPTKPDETASPEIFADAVVAAVRRHHFDHVTTVQSFDWRTLRLVKERAPEIATACLTIETERTNNVRPAAGPSWTAELKLDDHGGSVPQFVAAAGCATWSPFWRNVDASRMAEAKAAGLKTVPWTVNEVDDMRRLIVFGVDGLITDYPDRAGALLKSLGRLLR